MKTKVCSICNKEKPLSSYYKNNNYKDGLMSKCKKCFFNKDRIAYMKKYRKDNREQIKIYQGKYFIENKEKVRKLKRDWHKKNDYKYNTIENKIRNSESRKELYKKRISAWIDILSKHNYTKCKICGFNEDFCAIDLHHINGNPNKIIFSRYYKNKVTKERIDYILKETIPLCANCHRMIHHSEKYKNYKF